MRPSLRRDRRGIAPAALAVGVVVVLGALAAVVIASAPGRDCRVSGTIFDGLREGTPPLGGAHVRIVTHGVSRDTYDPVLASMVTQSNGAYDLRVSCGSRGIGEGYQLVASAAGHYAATRNLPFAVDGPVDLVVNIVLVG